MDCSGKEFHFLYSLEFGSDSIETETKGKTMNRRTRGGICVGENLSEWRISVYGKLGCLKEKIWKSFCA